jgi:hypothetical protein
MKGTPRLKQLLTLADRPGGIRANKITSSAAGIGVPTLCQYLRRYTDNGLLFRHGTVGNAGRSDRGYWYTLTPRGRQVLANVEHTLGRYNDDQTVAGRLRRFFLANPDEEMGFDDLATKLGLSTKRLSWCVKLLSSQGLIESVHIVRLRPEALARLKLKAAA